MTFPRFSFDSAALIRPKSGCLLARNLKDEMGQNWTTVSQVVSNGNCVLPASWTAPSPGVHGHIFGKHQFVIMLLVSMPDLSRRFISLHPSKFRDYQCQIPLATLVHWALGFFKIHSSHCLRHAIKKVDEKCHRLENVWRLFPALE